jgi:hypothetical protein
MTLVHRAGLVTSVRIANRRTIVHVHARVGVIAMPSPPMFVRCTTARERSSVGTLLHQRALPATAAAPVTDTPTTGLERPHVVDTASAFTRVPEVFAHRARQRHAERREAERHDPRAIPMQLFATRRRPLAVTGAQVDLSMRLRQRAVRQELPIPNRTTVLARTAASAGAAPRTEAIEREQVVPMRAEWTAPVTAPAVNVEALTSQVIQQLDRRLLAYRERMGRV